MPLLLSLLPGLAPDPPRREFLALGAVRDGNLTILSREGEGDPKAANLVSLGELLHWRSPRGLNYRTGERTITITPFDRSGSAAFRIADGRVESASGSLIGLRGKRLVRRVRGSEGTFFLTVRREDYLVDVRNLKAYFGDRLSREGGKVRLYATYWPSVVLPEGWKGPKDPVSDVDNSSYFHYGGAVSAIVNGLRIEVARWTLREERVGRALVQRHTDLSGTLTNESASPMVVQPYRIGFYDGFSLPCAFSEYTTPDVDPYMEAFGFHPFKQPVPNQRCRSMVLNPRQTISFAYETYRTPWAKKDGYAQRLRYADGGIDATFTAFFSTSNKNNVNDVQTPD